MAGKRAAVLRNWMGLIDLYTLTRAFEGLTQEEFDWEPHAGAWGIRRREECTTANPTGADESPWVSDTDLALEEAADRGEAVGPLTTIGWLLNHVGAAPELTARFDFVGGPIVPTPEEYERMWGRAIIPTVDEAVARFQAGWTALGHSLRDTTDEMLERDCDGHPWKRGDRAIAAVLNEVSHHGTQICVLRDLYAHRPDEAGTST